MFRKVLFSFVSLLIVAEKTNAQAVNIDFEASLAGTYTTGNSVSGWSLTSQTATNCSGSSWVSGSPEFSLVNTPISGFPITGFIPNSPLGGYVVASLNNQTANSSITRLSQSFFVSGANTFLQFAYAGVWQNHGSVLCCQEAGFDFLLKDQNGNLLSCSSLTLGGSSCQATGITYSVAGNGTYNWTNWQIKAIDLSPYINSNITVEIIANDCIYGDHYGTLLCDLKFGLPFSCFCSVGFVSNDPYFGPKFCSGSSIAQISAPLGYATYSWTGPSVIPQSQSTLATITVTNQPLGSVYTVSMMTFNGCVYTATYALNTTTVSIAGITSNSTCVKGSSGSATVIGTGSGTGYNYAWYNSNNSIVGTGPVVSNLSAGVYTVSVTSAGSTSATCGTAISTVTVGTLTPTPINLSKPFCGSTAYFSAPLSGTNYQWYYNQAAISSSLGGTNSSYTLSNAATGSIVTLGVTSQGCRDSIQYYLNATQSGSLSSIVNPIACPNGTNGTITLSMSIGGAAQFGTYSFSIVNSNSLTPSYSVISNNGNSYIFTASGLASNGNYIATSFDGACYYNLNFSVTPYNFNASLSAPTSNTLCSNSTLNISVNLGPTAPGMYNFLWTPYLNFWAGINTHSTALIMTSSLSPGTQTTITYSVVITPTFINCPQTKTFNVTFANPIPPGISNVPDLCDNQNTYTIITTPSADLFSGNSGVSSTGIITPSLAIPGINNFSAAIAVGSCVAQSTGTFLVKPSPTLQISGNTSICKGQSATLLAQGAGTYSWNGIAGSPVFVSSPTNNATYSVTGANGFGCYSGSIVPIYVTQIPTLSLTGDSVICKGESTLLYAIGADSYNWSGNINSPTISVSPSVSTTYVVTGINNPGSCQSASGITVKVIDCSTTGLLTNLLETSIRIYPNPGNGQFLVETGETIELTVFDALGRMLLQEEKVTGNYLIDLRNYANGNYVVKLSNDTKNHYVRLLKDH
ncbi:MAG: T9SS type A sorting domain-containing protein [Bacteroidia bacterium]|nr:T9SS type A sorting domain-containing protein [Bacteroidia bacterium]